MKSLAILIGLFWLPVSFVSAQSIEGVVMELNSSREIAQVEVTNLTTGQSVNTNSKGEFSLKINVNDLVSFEYPGYRVDTLLITDTDYKRVYLTPIQGYNILRDVEITELSDAQLDEEIAIAKEQGKSVSTIFGGGIAISPSRLFGNKAKEARTRHDLLVAEKNNRFIMSRFTPQLIQSLTPLTGQELDIFIAHFKPSYEFIASANQEQIAVYIIDSYKKYKSLPESEKEKLKLEP